jgi:hypothetical protein
MRSPSNAPSATRTSRYRRSAAALLTPCIVATMGSAATAMACPRCAAGIAARREVWNDDFGFNLLATIVPFFVIGTLSFIVERMGAPRGVRMEERP